MDTVSGCNSTENLVLKEVNLPLKYQQVSTVPYTYKEVNLLPQVLAVGVYYSKSFDKSFMCTIFEKIKYLNVNDQNSF